MNAELFAWYQTLAEQHAGKASLFVLCCVAFGYALYIRRQEQTIIRIAPGAAYLLALVVAAGNTLVVVPPALLAGGLAYVWRDWFRRIPRLALVLALAALVRIPMLFQSLWYDETFTAMVAGLPFDKMWTVIQSDVHPPLFYWLTHLSIKIVGTSEPAFRLIPYLCGVLSVYLVYRLYPGLACGLKRSERGALVAAGLTAVMPAMLFHANDARGYTLLLCAVLVMLIAVVEDRPVLFAISSIVAMMTHNLAVLYFAVIAAWALWLYVPVSRRWLAAAFMPALIFAVWLPVMLAQSRDIANGFWIEPLSAGRLITPLFFMEFGERYPSSFQPFSGIAVYVMTLAALAYGWQRWQSWTVNKWLWLVAGIGVPVLLAVISLLWRNIYLERALLPSAALLIMLWSKFLTEGERGDVRGVLLIFAPALLIAALWYQQPQFNRTNTREKLNNACHNLPVFTTSIGMAIVGNYYLPDKPSLWTGAGDMNQWLSDDAKAAVGWNLTTFEALPPGQYCIIDAGNALNRPDEREYMQQLLRNYPALSSQQIVTTDTYSIRAHIVEK